MQTLKNKQKQKNKVLLEVWHNKKTKKYYPHIYNKHENLSALTRGTPSFTHTLLWHISTASATSAGSPTATRTN